MNRGPSKFRYTNGRSMQTGEYPFLYQYLLLCSELLTITLRMLLNMKSTFLAFLLYNFGSKSIFLNI